MQGISRRCAHSRNSMRRLKYLTQQLAEGRAKRLYAGFAIKG
jgi:hypothetical protein